MCNTEDACGYNLADEPAATTYDVTDFDTDHGTRMNHALPGASHVASDIEKSILKHVGGIRR